uniref:hypothetical protein n=1 Tax=Castellaniella ginsengisoli TaxID=546114 RepID=UPI003F659290
MGCRARTRIEGRALYIGTPFYRVFALGPASGEVRWEFDTHSTLEAMTQPALKTRGVAYWEAEDPQAGQPCQKIVYIGTMDAQLFALDADTGRKCEAFGRHGVVNMACAWKSPRTGWACLAGGRPTASWWHWTCIRAA